MKFLKYNIVTSLLILNVTLTSAQQDPYFSHYSFNKSAYNSAAVVEKSNSICISSISHKQWVNFDDVTAINRETGQFPSNSIHKDVAPVTHNLNISAPIYTRDGWSSDWFWGLSLMSDKVSFFKGNTVKFNLARKIQINRLNSIAIGTDFGLGQIALHNPKYIARTPNDPKIPESGISISDQKPDLGFSIYYQYLRWRSFSNSYVGISAQHLNQGIYDLNYFNFNQESHLYLTAGTHYDFAGRWQWQPSVLIKYRSKPQFDFNNSLILDRKFRAGLAYRHWANVDAISGMLGYINGRTQIGYSYDFTISQIKTVSAGSHEIMVSYCIPIKVKYDCIRNIRWL